MERQRKNNIVLVVGLLIVMNAGKLSDWLFGTAKLASTEQSLAAFRVNIQHAYTDVRSYASISNDELISALVVPPTMLNGDGTAIVDAWNGDVTVASADDGRSFTIELTLFPSLNASSSALSRSTHGNPSPSMGRKSTAVPS